MFYTNIWSAKTVTGSSWVKQARWPYAQLCKRCKYCVYFSY